MITEKIGFAFIFYRFLRNSYFHVAFSILYFKSLGFSLSESLALESFYYLSKAICEVPSGVFADYFGRKRSLVIGAILAAGCYLGMGYFERYWAMAIFEIGLGISMSLTSGTDSALLYEEYVHVGKIDEYEKVESIGWGMRNIARGVASAIGSIFATWYSMATTFIMTAVVISISVPIAALSLKESVKTSNKINSIVKSSFTLITKNAAYRRVMLQFAIITIGVKVGFWAFQPFAELHGIELRWIGTCFTLLLFVTLAASFYVERICSKFGFLHTQTLLIVSAFFLIGLSFVVPVHLALLSASAGFVLHAIAQGISDPIMRIVINRNAESKNRATAMSLASMAGDSAFSAIAPPFGYIVDAKGGAAACILIIAITLLALIPNMLNVGSRMRTHFFKS